jgi:hypothetical protein
MPRTPTHPYPCNSQGCLYPLWLLKAFAPTLKMKHVGYINRYVLLDKAHAKIVAV